MVFETYDLGEKRTVSRACNIIDLSSDGSYVRMIVSDAYDCGKEELMFYPQSLFKQVIDSAGYGAADWLTVSVTIPLACAISICRTGDITANGRARRSTL